MTDKNMTASEKFREDWGKIWEAIEKDAAAKGWPFRKSSFREACKASGILVPYPYQP